MPTALAGAALSARFGNRNVVIGASLATAVGMLPLAFIPHWGAAWFSLMLVSGLSGVRYAASIVYFLELVPPNRRATTTGVTEMAAGICFTALTFGGGYIITLLGYRRPLSARRDHHRPERSGLLGIVPPAPGAGELTL